MNESVSVIIPFYSGVEWLEEAVESVLQQTYKVHEIIVVNDGSKENVDGFLEKYGNDITYILKENGGPATARNTGIEVATGTYIAFLDSDDLWLPEKLEIQIAEMIKTGALWSHTAYETFDTLSETKETLSVVTIGKFNGDIFPQMAYSNPLATPCIVIHSSVLKEHPEWRFNPKMRHGQDQYLWMCIAPHYPILAIEKTLVRVRMRGGNAALKARVQLRAKAVIYRTIFSVSAENEQQLTKSARYAFKLCCLLEDVLAKFEKNMRSKVIAEYISRCFYLIPYIIFKMNSTK